jgi:type III pantothenate kinase
MRVVLDIGNSDYKWGLVDGAVLLDVCRGPQLPDWPNVTEAVVASVVPEKTLIISAQLQRAGIATVRHVQPETGLIDLNGYPPEQLGPDRYANLCAVRHLAPCVVVDFGTATTFGALDGEGRFVHGAIVPGLRTFIDSLAEKTARLPRIPFPTWQAIPAAASTETSLAVGVAVGYVGMVEALLATLTPPQGRVVATGGLAQTFLDLWPPRTQGLFHTVDPLLTLKGLAQL